MAFPKEAAQCKGVFLVVFVSVTDTSIPALRRRSNCSRLQDTWKKEEKTFVSDIEPMKLKGLSSLSLFLDVFPTFLNLPIGNTGSNKLTFHERQLASIHQQKLASFLVNLSNQRLYLEPHQVDLDLNLHWVRHERHLFYHAKMQITFKSNSLWKALKNTHFDSLMEKWSGTWMKPIQKLVVKVLSTFCIIFEYKYLSFSRKILEFWHFHSLTFGEGSFHFFKEFFNNVSSAKHYGLLDMLGSLLQHDQNKRFTIFRK